MIGLVCLLLAPPESVVIVTPRGEARVPVTLERGAPAVAASRLVGPLGLVVDLEVARATVRLADGTFIFELGAPFVRIGATVFSLAGAPYRARDTLFLPLHWLVEIVPRALGARFQWDPAAARLVELAPGAPAAVAAPHPLTGLRQPHAIVIDPGHGGRDPGNLGLYLPPGVSEKDVNLAIARLLRAELARRGVEARLTRVTDSLVDLEDRGPMCSEDCDVFVSIHVNAMPLGRRRTAINGVEVYFLSDAKTEDQKRVAKMENDAIRFETGAPAVLAGDLGFILRDLQQNEYLRESARLAELVQHRVAGAHPGEDRGVQQAGFVVLSRARRPAILVEAGFATHRGDADFLASALGQRKIANAIADGIVAYLLEFERKLLGGASGGEEERAWPR